jgi:multisubunit Na+/H+ antiporter MnhB subunit
MRVSNVLIAIGVTLLVIGVALRYFPGLFSWFGNLPGDIRRETENTTVFIPITSMLVVSVVLTIVLNVVGHLFRGE